MCKDVGHCKVLVIDDDAATTLTFARMLRLDGFQVATAMDGKEGVREAVSDPPDAILLDLRMPLLDGVAFLRSLRQAEMRQPSVGIVTGDYYVDDETSEQLLGLGATIAFKPLWLEDIV